MRILVFNWRCWFNPDRGGAETYTHEVTKKWVQQGHEVTLFTSQFSNSPLEEVSNGVRIVRSGDKYSVYKNAKKHYAQRFAHEDFDVVIDEINTRPFFAHKFVKNGEEVIALIHQLAREYWFYETQFPLSFLGYHFFENRWLSNYTKIPTVTVSESTRRDLVQLGFEDISVVSEGLSFEPLTSLQEKETHPVVIYVGRLKHAKRPDHAIRAYQILKRKIPTAELWIVGDGPFAKDLKAMSHDGVKFFGHLSSSQLTSLIQKAWVLVNPSVREGWGLNVTEANALGTPCVAYDVAGLRDSVIHGETGLLVSSGDIRQLAETLENVLTNKELRNKLSKNALQNSKKYSWNQAASEFMAVIENVQAKKGAGFLNAD